MAPILKGLVIHPKWNYQIALCFFGSLCKLHTGLFWVIPPGIIESHFDFLVHCANSI